MSDWKSQLENYFTDAEVRAEIDARCAGFWLSVNDGLPDEEIEVLVHTISGVVFLAGLCDGRWTTDSGSPIKTEITHWMEVRLPKNSSLKPIA